LDRSPVTDSEEPQRCLIGSPTRHQPTSPASSPVSAALDQVIPPKQPGENLLIGTWNVRAFDRLTPKWRSVSGDSPIRDLSNLLCIAEVMRRFDVVAVQEIRRTAQALLAMLQVLGEGWAFVVTDVTRGRLGNAERLAFVFDRQRVRPSGLACELVVAAEDAGIPEATLQRQFARTPYAVSFAGDPGSSRWSPCT
jgi:hypothetical protein